MDWSCGCGFVVTLSNSMTSACLLGMAFSPTFAAIISKRDCVSQFILTNKLEKMIAKSKQNSQHHSTHSGGSKTLI
jgi:hypothetical protein